MRRPADVTLIVFLRLLLLLVLLAASEATALCLATSIPTLIQDLQPLIVRGSDDLVVADEHRTVRTELQNFVKSGIPDPWLLIAAKASTTEAVIVFGRQEPTQLDSLTARSVARIVENRRPRGTTLLQCSDPLELSRIITLLAHHTGGRVGPILTARAQDRHIVTLDAIPTKSSTATLAVLEDANAKVDLKINGRSWEGLATLSEWATVVRGTVTRWVAQANACEEIHAIRLDARATKFRLDSRRVCHFDRDKTESDDCNFRDALDWINALNEHLPRHCRREQPKFIVHGFADGFFEHCDPRSPSSCDDQRNEYNRDRAERRAAWVARKLQEEAQKDAFKKKKPSLAHRIVPAAKLKQHQMWFDQSRWDRGLSVEYCQREKEDDTRACRIARVTVGM